MRIVQYVLHYWGCLCLVMKNNHGIYNLLLLNILQVISQKYGHNL